MRFKTLLILKAAVCLFFGPLLLLAPGWLFALLGTSLGPGGAFPAREYGAAMCGILVLTWLARDTPPSGGRREILLALLVYDGIGVVITVHAIASHVLNVLAWGIALVYLFFTIGPASVLRRERHAARSPA
jgi:hypothetical protein